MLNLLKTSIFALFCLAREYISLISQNIGFMDKEDESDILGWILQADGIGGGAIKIEVNSAHSSTYEY